MSEYRILADLAQETGQLAERNRIAKEYVDYPRREEIPLEIQKDLAKIIMVDIVFPPKP